MVEVWQMHMGTLLQVAEALEAVVCRCLGPYGGQVLFTKDTGEVLMTREGGRILSALQLAHPVARVLVSCVMAHCAITGDGAKSFIVLLVALLRGAQSICKHQAGGKSPRGRLVTSRLARGLLSFQTRVLDDVMREHIVPRATSLFSCASTTEARNSMRLLMEAFFQGRVGATHFKFLAEMACDFYYRCNCEADRDGTLQLINDHFPELHTPVTGLPIGRSRVLEGLVLHRDFAVHCPTEGPLKTLAVRTALQPPLADPDSILFITASHQFQGCSQWIARQVEETIAALQQLQVKLLLSAVKQSDLVLYHTRRAGLSVVECLDEDELSFFCSLAGTTPLTNMSDWTTVVNSHITTVTFCQPVVLGPHRYAQVGFPEGQHFFPHCLVICGPTPGITDQCIAAFCSAIRLLQQVCGAVCCHGSHGGKGDIIWKGYSLEKKTNLQERGNMINASRHDTDSQTESHKCWQRALSAGQINCRTTQKECTVQTLMESGYTAEQKTANGQGCDSGKASEEGDKKFSEITDILIKPGAVLPAGGDFEFLLHQYLLKHAFHSCCTDTQAVCRLVAESLLSVPRQVYSHGDANRHFLKVRTRFVSAIQCGEPTRPVTENLVGVESLACKYQLLLSVLQCLGRLLTVDAIIHTASFCIRHQVTEDEDQEE